MAQVKALNALEPFLALSKSATSPRAAADLVTRATSSPNTFVFAELLQTAPVAALASSPDYAAHHALLEIFSHGTYEAYAARQEHMPPLSDAQVLKLRQLSLLSLARDRDNLSYTVLSRKLGLDSHRAVEALVVGAIYAGLLEATLDPSRQAVQVTGIAPLRDLAPGSVPDMIAVLDRWSNRCTSTLEDLETQVQGIRDAATKREAEAATADQKLQDAVDELKEAGDKKHDAPGAGPHREQLSKRAYMKRVVGHPSSHTQAQQDADTRMDVDEPLDERRASKRKM